MLSMNRMIAAGVLVVTMTVAAAVAVAAPPPTPIDPVTEVIHGVEIVDEYRWLESLESECEEVKAWTTRQNEYTRSILDNIPGRDRLEARLSELMTIDQISSPTMRADRYFFTRRTGGQNQAVLYVREGYDGEDRALIDPNTLDEQGLYSLDWHVPNADGTLLAFGLSYAGDEMTVAHIMDVATGEWLADEITGKVRGINWLPDSSGFLYGVLDEPADAYSRAIRLHTIGRHPRQNPMLFRQVDPSRIPGAMLSRDGNWLIKSIFAGWAQQNLWVVDYKHWQRTGEFNPVPIAVDLDARFSAQFIRGDTLYLFTTLGAPNGKLYAVDLTMPARENWIENLPERDDAVLQSVSEARGLFVASYQKNVVTVLERFRMDGTPLGELDLPGLGTASVRTHHDRTEAFVSFTSFDTPPSIYRTDLREGELELWARPDVPVDPSLVEVKQEWATSKDGTRIPMFIVHGTGVTLDGNNPTVLYGYGGFNISMRPSFAATRFPWFEAGGVYVVANLRGGSEFGESWHRAGMLGNKQNVFDDFIAVAEHLIERGYTSPQRLGIDGRSNGGLLTGAAVTQRPDLFRAAISGVPLLDMIRYHEFLMARFWVPEYGSSEDPAQFAWLYAYSPYHNIRDRQVYPAMLFTAGENDNRTHPLHARKMAAAMQAKAANDPAERPIMLWVDRHGGHGAGKPLHLRIRDVADQWAFFMSQLGVSPSADAGNAVRSP
jgi:prolyl oligopeptidase